jgi:phosphate transport system substrate-binding protein
MKALIKYYLAIPSLCLISYALQASPTILFSIHGSNTVGEKLAPQCARDYLRSIKVEDVEIHTTAVTNEYMIGGTRGQGLDMEKVAIKVAAHGSSTGFKAILSGEADIAMSSRPIKAKEVEALQAFGDMLSQQAEHTIAIDGLAILVNKTNAINALTIEQIANVFSGELTNWQQLGGNNKPITIYARDDKSGTWDTFKKLVFNGRCQLSETALRFESNTELSDQVSQIQMPLDLQVYLLFVNLNY